jgi:metal-dependent amidase/aminoacylase/carboxypeptidase family protein
MNMISEEVLALEPDIIAWRRHMHQNPELSFQEVHTTAYLTEELKDPGSDIGISHQNRRGSGAERGPARSGTGPAGGY